MKKRIGILLTILAVFLLLHFLSGFIHRKSEEWLKNRILISLPEGSSVGEVNWDILSSLEADSVFLKGVGFLSKIEIFYSPLDILRRRIKKVSLIDPRIFLSLPESKEEKERKIPGLFYIEDLSVSGGSLIWKGHKFLLNVKGTVFSTGEEFVLNISTLKGKVDSLDFSLSNGRFTLGKRESRIEVKELKTGRSQLEFSGKINETIKGEGRVYLSDLKPLWNIKGEGFVDVQFTYDSIIAIKGKTNISSIGGINLTPFEVEGTMDSLRIKGDELSGYLKITDHISGCFKLNDFNMKEFKKNLPNSKLNGEVKFAYLNMDSLQIASNLNGILLDSRLRDFDIEVKKFGNRFIIEECNGYFNEGRIRLSGEYDNIIKGNLFVENFEISPLLSYFGIDGLAIVDADLSIQEKVYGAFSIDSLHYGAFSFGLLEGNVNLRQEKSKFPGEVSFVAQDINFKGGNVFDVGEVELKIGEGKLDARGSFKSGEKQMDYSLSYFGDSIRVQKIMFEYPGGWLSSTSPFSLEVDRGVRIRNARFTGNKGESFRIRMALAEDNLSGKMELNDFKPQILKEFGVITHPISGSLSGTASLSGKLGAPDVEFNGRGEIQWKGRNVGDSLNLLVTYQKDKIFLKNITIFDKTHPSRFTGSIEPTSHLLNINATFDKAGRWIFYPIDEYADVREAELTGSLRVKGQMTTPLVYGVIKVQKGNLLLIGPGIRIKDLKSEIQFKGNAADLYCRTSLGKGGIEARGGFGIKERSLNLKLSIIKTPINWQYVEALIDGNLIVSKEKENIKIEGNIDLKKATVTMEFKQRERSGARPSNLYLDLNFDASKGNIWIRNEMADIESAGKVGVNYEGGPLLLSGNLTVKQGNFYYLYRSFEVVEGEFYFKNSPELNPNIDIKAKTLVQDRDTVFLVVSGTMRIPEFDLYSKPPLSKADIMTLLSLNLTWQDLSSVKSIEESITETAFNYWVRQTFSKRFKERFGIDLLQMEGVGGCYEVVFGKYITDRLFVKARADIQSYGLSEIQAEYKLKRWGSITAENDFSGKTRFLFRFGWRY